MNCMCEELGQVPVVMPKDLLGVMSEPNERHKSGWPKRCMFCWEVFWHGLKPYRKHPVEVHRVLTPARRKDSPPTGATLDSSPDVHGKRLKESLYFGLPLARAEAPDRWNPNPQGGEAKCT